MSNPYYNHTTGVPAELTRGTSSLIRNEFDLVGTGFDDVYAQIAALAAAVGIPISVTEVPLASAATTDIGNGYGPVISITGVVTITSFGTNYISPIFIKFAGALTLTHSATLVCPGAENIVTEAGDVCIVSPLGNPASGWRITHYARMSKGIIYDTLASTTAGKGAALVGAEDGSSGSLWTTVQGFINKIISSAGASVVGFIQSGAGAVATTVEDELRSRVRVEQFGALGDGATDDTAAITAALAAHDCIELGPKTYVISALDVGDGKSIITNGKATIIQQKTGTAIGTRIINIVGSNIDIGSLTILGNISTDTDEQNHSIYVRANATNGNLSNIRIGDVTAINIRGDGIYIGAMSGYSINNINIGHVHGQNIYRNVVSITGGKGINIDGITGTEVGNMHFDIEPEPTYTAVTQVNVGFVKGRHCGIVSSSATNYCDGIYIASLDLDPSYTTGSTPTYAPGSSNQHALQVRNTKSLHIVKFKANGFDGQAIKQIYNGGELAKQRISIDHAEITDCIKTEVLYQSLILGTKGVTVLEIGHLEASVTKASDSIIRGFTFASLKSAIISDVASSRFIYDVEDSYIGNLVHTGGGIVAQLCNRVTIENGSIAATADRILSTSTFCTLRNVTATATTPVVGGTGYETHSFINCVINGSYYANGFYLRDYSQSVRFGGFYIWSDTSGQLRIKNGAPASDFDGNPINATTLTATSAQIADKTHAINTAAKTTGKTVWDSTNNRLMRSAGTTDVSAWWVVDGSASVTPV